MLEAVLDEVGDGADLEVVLLAELLEVRQPRHGAVVLHDLADHPGGLEPRQPAKVHGTLGLTRAYQHAAGPWPVAGRCGRACTGRLGSGLVPDGRQDGLGPVGCRYAGGNVLDTVDGDRERGAEGRRVVPNHHGQAELVDLFLGKRQADQAPSPGGHEVDGLRGDQFRGHGQVTLVLAVLVIHQDDHLALPDVFKRFFNGGYGHGFLT